MVIYVSIYSLTARSRFNSTPLLTIYFTSGSNSFDTAPTTASGLERALAALGSSLEL